MGWNIYFQFKLVCLDLTVVLTVVSRSLSLVDTVHSRLLSCYCSLLNQYPIAVVNFSILTCKNILFNLFLLKKVEFFIWICREVPFSKSLYLIKVIWELFWLTQHNMNWWSVTFHNNFVAHCKGCLPLFYVMFT